MDPVEAIGFLAGFITVISLLPQTIQVWRTRSTHDLSLLSYSMMSCGAILWLTYGLLKWDMPIILPNAINLVLLTLILVAKVRFR